MTASRVNQLLLVVGVVALSRDLQLLWLRGHHAVALPVEEDIAECRVVSSGRVAHEHGLADALGGAQREAHCSCRRLKLRHVTLVVSALVVRGARGARSCHSVVVVVVVRRVIVVTLRVVH